MSIQKAKSAIKKLLLKQLSDLSSWLEYLQARAWDQHIKADLLAGHLDSILNKVDAEYKAGLSEPLVFSDN